MTDQDPYREDEAEKEEKELKPVKLSQAINIRGQSYQAGETVNLSDEDLESLKAAGVRYEGDEAEDKSNEDLQKEHQEASETVRKQAEERELESAKKFEQDKAYEAGHDFDEEGFKSEYERKKKLTKGDDFQMPEENEERQKAAQEISDNERKLRGADKRTVESRDQPSANPPLNPPAPLPLVQGGSYKP